MNLRLENLPVSLADQRKVMARCLVAMDRALPLHRVYLFGSHARGEAGCDSDIDLCIVSPEAENQLPAAAIWRLAMRPVWPRPAFTLVPISPLRLEEKQACNDHFFHTVLTEGALIVTED